MKKYLYKIISVVLLLSIVISSLSVVFAAENDIESKYDFCQTEDQLIDYIKTVVVKDSYNTATIKKCCYVSNSLYNIIDEKNKIYGKDFEFYGWSRSVNLDIWCAQYFGVYNCPVECMLNKKAAIFNGKNYYLLEIKPYFAYTWQEYYRDTVLQDIYKRLDLSSYNSTFDKVLVIYKWFSTHIFYGKDKISDLKEYEYNSSYGSFGPVYFKHGVCQGLSYLFEKMCTDNGINCICITNSNHMWNFVEMDNGYWYAVDMNSAGSLILPEFFLSNPASDEYDKDNDRFLEKYPASREYYKHIFEYKSITSDMIEPESWKNNNFYWITDISLYGDAVKVTVAGEIANHINDKQLKSVQLLRYSEENTASNQCIAEYSPAEIAQLRDNNFEIIDNNVKPNTKYTYSLCFDFGPEYRNHTSYYQMNTNITTDKDSGHNFTMIKSIYNGCEKKNTGIFKCTKCGYTKEDIDFGDDINTVKTHHNYVSKVTKHASGCSNGIKTYTCTECNESYDIVIPREISGQDHDWEVKSTTPATCKALAVNHLECANCGVKKDESTGTFAPHKYELQAKVEPTCVKSGQYNYICSVCGVSKSEVKNALGHNYTQAEPMIKATTGEDGRTALYQCSRCKETYGGEVIPNIDAEGSYLAKSKYEYTSKGITPSLTVLDRNGKVISSDNYTVSYNNNTNIGRALVTVKFNSDSIYSGFFHKYFTIVPCSSAKATLEFTSCKYTGKDRKPKVTIKNNKITLKSNTDYVVTYNEKCTNVGTYTVTIKYKGNYIGSEKLTYTINPPPTKITKINSVKNGFNVTYTKKATQTTGYQVQYATDDNFTKNKVTKTINKNTTTTKTFNKLSKNTKYYVRVKTYKELSNKKYYSNWSDVKTVKTM